MRYSEDKVFRYFKESLDMSGGDGEWLYESFFRDHPEYDPLKVESAPEIPSRLFDRWLRNNYFAESLGNVESEISYRVDENGMIPIWRVITASRNWTPSERNLGVYWSWDKNAARAHWGDHSSGKIKWRIGSIAEESQVDWNLTLALNMHPSLGQDEKEIRLKEGSVVPILSLETSEGFGEDFEPVENAWSGKKFAANPRRRR